MKNKTQNRPKYNKLYADMIRDKYPEKASLCGKYLGKGNWSALDVIHVNELLFGSMRSKNTTTVNQKHRAYDKDSILQILQDQIQNKLNNSQLANKYNLSKNTVAKWKRLFPLSDLDRS